MAGMGKWTPAKQTQQIEPQPVEIPSLPAGRWMRVRPVRENGVSGWALDECIQQADGSFLVKRIHGPDLFDITVFRHEQEVSG
jgi:hypothetical protein